MSFGGEMTTVQPFSVCKRKYIYLSTYQEISQGTPVYLDIVGNSHIAPTPACKNANWNWKHIKYNHKWHFVHAHIL